jgi:membrane-bound serine protease (ClpP class)
MAAEETLPAAGQFVTITSPIDDIVYSRVSNAALKLQAEAVQSDQKAVLVLQIPPGASPFHQVQGLAKFLTSPQINQVTTVAWIPENLTGPHVLLALACREIVMPDDVQIGDLSRGARLDPEEEQAALAVAQKRLNPKVNAALVRGLFDPQEALYRIRIKPENGAAESRIVTREELEAIRKTNAVIEEAVAVKEAGSPGIFTGKAARGWDILVTHLADSRSTVGELYHLPHEAQREMNANQAWNQVRVIRIQGLIDPMLESFLVRQIHQAEADGVQVLIFELDSSGGQLLPSITLAFAIAELDPQRIRTVAYVPEKAFSGAAVVAMGCDDVYLTPTARWGNASPSNHREAAKFERSPDKISQLKLALKTLADKKGRPAALAAAMADRSTVVYQTQQAENGRTWYHTAEELHASRGEWNQGPVLPDADGTRIFIADGRRAAELKLAEPPVESFDELKARLAIPATAKITRAQPTWVDQLVFVLNRPEMTVLLLVLAISLLYLELHFSTTLLGLMSVVCFALFFWSKVLGGTAGSLEIMLFVLGVVSLGVEAFLVPGFGVFGLTGIALVLSSLVMASQTFGNLEPSADWNQLASSFGTIFVALVAMGLVGVGLSRLLPSLPFLDGLVLSPPGSATDHGNEPQLRTKDESAGQAAIGLQGVALSVLRPAGKAQFGDRVLDVISDGPFIPAGSTIEIVSATRTRIVVKQA